MATDDYRFTVRLDRDQHQLLRLLASARDESMQQTVLAALQEFISDHAEMITSTVDEVSEALLRISGRDERG